MSASATQLVLLLVAVEAAVRSCDTFGCAFVVEPLGVVAALVVAATVGYLVLRVARVAKALPVAATAGVAVGPAWVFGFGLGSPTLSMALLIGVGAAAYGLGYLLYARSPLPVPLTLTITVALLVASVVPAGALGQRVDDSRYRNAEQHRLEQFAQPIYLPATVPARYSFHRGTLHPADRIGKAFYEATYLFDKNNSGDPSPFTLLSFRTSHLSFHPHDAVPNRRPAMLQAPAMPPLPGHQSSTPPTRPTPTASSTTGSSVTPRSP